MQIDWWTLGLQTINFLIVIWLLSRFLYRPIRNIVEEREAADKAASDAAAEKLAKAEEIRRTYEEKAAQLAENREEQDAAFHRRLEEERAKSLEAARTDAAALLDKARAKIDEEQRQALQALKHRIAELASGLARTALAGPAALDETLAQVGTYLRELPRADLDDLKEDLGSGDAALTLVTPRQLSDAEKEAWRATLANSFGTATAIVFTEAPELLGGAELHFPHAVLRFSVADRLNRAAQALEV